MVDRNTTRDESANYHAFTDAIKLRMEIAEGISKAVKSDPSIYQCIDRERLSLVMVGNGTMEDILYVFRMCKLKFRVEVVDIGSVLGEWY
jgi:hypothetical protein